MLDIRKILVPTDFSGTADLATRHAVSFAELFDAEITLFHGRTIFRDDPVNLDADLEQVQADLKERSQQLVHSRGSHLRIKIEMARDVSASAAILNVLTENDFDLVVMGTHGRSGLAHFMLGSVAEVVVREAPCPVISIRPAAAREEVSPDYRNILVGFDFSNHSRAAVRHAAQLALRIGAKVEVLYVFEQQIHPAYYPIWDEMAVKILPEIEEDARATLTTIFKTVGLGDWDLKVSHARWRAPREIAAYAEEKQVDLIILGTHGFSGLDHFLLGSTSERVVRMAPCPVMTTKLGDQESGASPPGEKETATQS